MLETAKIFILLHSCSTDVGLIFNKFELISLYRIVRYRRKLSRRILYRVYYGTEVLGISLSRR